MERRVLLKKKASLPEMAEIVVTCPGGAEEVLAEEMHRLGLADIRKKTGAVRGRRTAAAGVGRANRELRTASRVLVPLAAGSAADYDAVYRIGRAVPWELFLVPEETFAIAATSRSDALSDHRYLAMRLKDSIVDRQREKFGGRRSSVDRSAPTVPVVVFASDEGIEISLDTSGAPLHERGYRTEHGEAPLRETVAAMMLLTARSSDAPVLVDPFCGSGTVAIEAALIAEGLYPGNLGRSFAWQRWPRIATALGASAVPPADTPPADTRRSDRGGEYPGRQRIIAGDIDPGMIAKAKRNAARAGVADRIEFVTGDVAETIARAGSAAATSSAGSPGGIVVTNPPYGARLQPADLVQVYRRAGDSVRRGLPGWVVWMILGDRAPVREFGLAPDRRIDVYNGGMAAQVCRYHIRERGGR